MIPIHFDTDGTRRRGFNQCVERMNGQTPQGGGLQLQGSATCLNLMKSLRDQGFTPTTFHEHWIRGSEIPKGDRSTYEHECLSRILEAAICVDQLNAPALQFLELVCRRMQVIREHIEFPLQHLTILQLTTSWDGSFAEQDMVWMQTFRHMSQTNSRRRPQLPRRPGRQERNRMLDAAATHRRRVGMAARTNESPRWSWRMGCFFRAGVFSSPFAEA